MSLRRNSYSLIHAHPEQRINAGSVSLMTILRRVTVPILFGLFCLCFVAGALRVAGKNYLWMDEVLAVWVARLPTFGQVWDALFRGSEAAPPGYHSLLHSLINAGANSYVLLRLPSILGSLISGLCVFAILRKYVDLGTAMYGMVFSLIGVLAWYAVEARPYTLVTACFAVAVLLWDGIGLDQSRSWRMVGISLALITATCLHFYATLLVLCLGLIELLWSALHRRIRVWMWITLFFVGAASFVWLPLIRADSRIIASEVAAGSFYANPTISRLIQTYASLVVHDKKQAVFLAATLFLIVATSALQQAAGRRIRRTEPSGPVRSKSNLYLIALGTLTFPLAVFVFALFVTKTFNTRYTLVGSIGFSLAGAYALSRLRIPRPAVYMMILAACPLAFLSGAPPDGVQIPNQLEVLAKASNSSYSIVVPDARLYFELAEAAPARLKARLVYVDLPRGSKNVDPTNEDHVDRWHKIRPDLRVLSAKEFFPQNPRFYVFHISASIYVITDWLLDRNLIGKPVAENEDCWLFEARAPDLTD